MVDTKLILIKANLFEKLATYGIRKGFLYALAQADEQSEQDKQIKRATEHLLNMHNSV
jgi:hypothetical protein